MLKRFINSRATSYLVNKPAARISELKEYVCLRESLNEQASNQAASQYQQLASKYNLSKEELTELFKVVHLEPELLKNYISHEDFLQDFEQLKPIVALSPFRQSGASLEETLKTLKAKYPDVVNFEASQPERVKAINTLESIFIRDGPALAHNGDNKAVLRFMKEFENRINGHINELRNTHKHKSVDAEKVHGAAVLEHNVDPVDEIAKALGVLYTKLEVSPAYVYGRIRHYIAVHNQEQGKTVTETRQPTRAELLEQARTTSLSQTLEEGNDLPNIIEEANKSISERTSYNHLPWINERKLIYEAKVGRNYAWAYGTLGGALAAYFLYKIYQGDAKYTYLATIALSSAFVFTRYRAHAIRAKFDHLVQLNVHRDGRNLDLFVQKANGQVAKIEGVPVADFKLHRGDYKVELPATDDYLATYERFVPNAAPVTNISLSSLRQLGAGRGSWVATYGENVVFVPMDYNGNAAVLDRLFRGKDLELN